MLLDFYEGRPTMRASMFLNSERMNMDAILRDLSPAALSRAIEENLYCFVPAMHGWPKAEVHEDPDMSWSITDLPYPLFNSVMRTRLPPEQADAAIDAVLDRYRARGVPRSWWIGPSTDPSDLGARLGKRGFACDRAPGMAVDLAQLREPTRPVPGLTVQIVHDETGAREWGFTCARGFEAPDASIKGIGETWADLLCHVDSGQMLAYLGCLDGEPVATSLLMYGAGVAGIYAVATVPEARRKGIGAAMTCAPLMEARSEGYAVGILQASEMGAPVYRSLGFREYCDVFEYFRRPRPD